jgi:hypothetical protein
MSRTKTAESLTTANDFDETQTGHSPEADESDSDAAQCAAFVS